MTRFAALALGVLSAGCTLVATRVDRKAPERQALLAPEGRAVSIELIPSAISRGPPLVVSRGEDAERRWFDLRAGIELRNVAIHPPWDWQEDDVRVIARAWSDRERAEGFDLWGRIRRWSGADGGRALPGLVGHARPVTALAYGSTDRLLSGDDSGEIRVWSLAETRLVAEYVTEGRSIRAVGWIDARPAALDAHGVLFVWSPEGVLQDRRSLGVGEIRQAVFDGRWAALDAIGRVWLVDLQGVDLSIALLETSHRARISGLILEEDRLLARTSDGRVRTYSMPSGDVVGFDQEAAPEWAPVEPFDVQLPGKPVDWARSPDGEHAAVATAEGWIAIWQVESGRRVSLRKAPSTCLAFDPVEPWIVRGQEDGWVVCERIADGEPVRRWRAHQGMVRDVAIDRDRLVTAGDGDEPLVVWSNWR